MLTHNANLYEICLLFFSSSSNVEDLDVPKEEKKKKQSFLSKMGSYRQKRVSASCRSWSGTWVSLGQAIGFFCVYKTLIWAEFACIYHAVCAHTCTCWFRWARTSQRARRTSSSVFPSATRPPVICAASPWPTSLVCNVKVRFCQVIHVSLSTFYYSYVCVDFICY